MRSYLRAGLLSCTCASVLSRAESFEVKSVAWDEFLGGHDFDAKLTKHFGQQFDKAHKSKMDGESIFDKPVSAPGTTATALAVCSAVSLALLHLRPSSACRLRRVGAVV